MDKAVIGLGFGDEGKGATVNWLASGMPDHTVCRFSGGHQAGHHVWCDEENQHVFASFGSGTLQGNATFISSPCVISPEYIINEHKRLVELGYEPELTVDPKCPITTPLDIEFNRFDGANRDHGTCGCGINATLEREKDNYHLLTGDLLYPDIFKAKVKLIDKHYYDSDVDWGIDEFYDLCMKVRDIIGIGVIEDEHLIYEGSQGLLLDKDIGFFPHCTPYNVGIKGLPEGRDYVDAYYVTRAYATRHGAGPMCSHTKDMKVLDNKYEFNEWNEYQKGFRKGMLNMDLIEYGARNDKLPLGKRVLVVTCLEHMVDLKYSYEGKVVEHDDGMEFCAGIARILGIEEFVMCIDHRFSEVILTKDITEEVDNGHS